MTPVLPLELAVVQCETVRTVTRAHATSGTVLVAAASGRGTAVLFATEAEGTTTALDGAMSIEIAIATEIVTEIAIELVIVTEIVTAIVMATDLGTEVLVGVVMTMIDTATIVTIVIAIVEATTIDTTDAKSKLQHGMQYAVAFGGGAFARP